MTAIGIWICQLESFDSWSGGICCKLNVNCYFGILLAERRADARDDDAPANGSGSVGRQLPGDNGDGRQYDVVSTDGRWSGWWGSPAAARVIARGLN